MNPLQNIENTALTLREQLEVLKSRGMKFRDERKAEELLGQIGYFHLKGYWIDMEEDPVRHIFRSDSYFENVLERYLFDHYLRGEIFVAVENIEIAFRARLTYHMARQYGQWWWNDESLFKSAKAYDSMLKIIDNEFHKSRNPVIQRYIEKRPDKRPEAWAIFESASLGVMVRVYGNLRDTLVEKRRIASDFGHDNPDTLFNWMESVCSVRNKAAHYSRLWNAPVKSITVPDSLPRPWVSSIPNAASLYAVICALVYLSQSLDQSDNIRKSFIRIIKIYDSLPLAKMGFPSGFLDEPLWHYHPEDMLMR
ncbi:MAG: Abi family protein [Bacteroidales bacterium]|nr:Abi family protein [Bacteroidales bacterium]